MAREPVDKRRSDKSGNDRHGHEVECQGRSGISRRRFLKTVGAGAAVAATAGALTSQDADAQTPLSPGEMARISLEINGRQHKLLVEPRWSLLYVLREHLGLTATKNGCERGECGSCTVLIDGKTRYACLTLAVESVGHEITTLEGLMHGEQLGPVQQAFVEEDGFQCGYCTPGQVMATEGFLRAFDQPTLSDEAICEGMSGNLCRCGAYPNIVRAVKRASELKRGGAR